MRESQKIIDQGRNRLEQLQQQAAALDGVTAADTRFMASLKDENEALYNNIRAIEAHIVAKKKQKQA